MLIMVKGWIAKGSGDCGSYRTTVTIATDSVTTALTLPGKHPRKAALRLAYNHLVREGDRWSGSFLRDLASQIRF